MGFKTTINSGFAVIAVAVIPKMAVMHMIPTRIWKPDARFWVASGSMV